MLDHIQVGDGRDSLEWDRCLLIGRHLAVLYRTMLHNNALGPMPIDRQNFFESLTDAETPPIPRHHLLDHFLFLEGRARDWMSNRDSPESKAFHLIKDRLALLRDLFQ
jgi:hypothetical protein